MKKCVVLALCALVALSAQAEELVKEAPKSWALGVSAYNFFVPDGGSYVQPTVTADRGRFHFEARHNYENLDTSSTWLGANFALGQEGEGVRLDLTPMLGVVSGKTDGIAPGYKATLNWGMLTAYTEGEFVIDKRSSADSFYYAWSELTVSPVEWLRTGFVTQRTRLYETERSTQRGLLLGVTYNRVGVTAHVFNPDQADPTYVLSVSLSF